MDKAVIAGFINSLAPQASSSPAPAESCSTAASPALRADPDSDFMECLDSASVTSSSRKRTAQPLSNSSTNCSSDSDGTVTDSAPFTLVKSKRGSKRAAKRRTPSISAAPAVVRDYVASTAASPAVAPAADGAPATPAAPAAAPSFQTPLDIPPPSKPATRCAPKLAKNQIPPPVFLRDKAKFTELSKTCYKAGIKYDQATNLGEAIKIIPHSIDDFRRLTRLFTAEKVAYHTYALQEERKVKAVIRGVPYELQNEDILEDLKSQGFPVEAVHKMHSNKGKKYPLALVILSNVPEAKGIFRQVSTVCGLSKIKIEPPHRRGHPAQCHRCQLYGHAAANCSAPPGASSAWIHIARKSAPGLLTPNPLRSVSSANSPVTQPITEAALELPALVPRKRLIWLHQPLMTGPSRPCHPECLFRPHLGPLRALPGPLKGHLDVQKAFPSPHHPHPILGGPKRLLSSRHSPPLTRRNPPLPTT